MDLFQKKKMISTLEEPDIDYREMNQLVDYIQKLAWRLVRAAEDKFGPMKGEEKRSWCVQRLQSDFPDFAHEADDFIRASYMGLKIEMEIIERRLE